MRGVCWALALVALPLAVMAQDVYDTEYYIELRQDAFQQLLVSEAITIRPAKNARLDGLRFSVPAGASSLRFAETLKRDGQHLTPVEPITEPTEFRFVYTLQGDGKRIRLVRRLAQRGSSFLGVCPEGRYRVVAEGVATERGVVDGNGRTWIQFRGEDLPKGHQISITLTHIEVDNPIEKLYVLLVLLILGGFACLIGGLTLAQRSEQRRDEKTTQYLLAQLTALEEARAADQVSAEYFEARQKELRELLER
jgi:hypothetical protein